MEWHELSLEDQKIYYAKALYLIDNHYTDKDIEVLAKEIYEKTKK